MKKPVRPIPLFREKQAKRHLGLTWMEWVLVLVVGAISYNYEYIKHGFPWLIRAQLKTYNWFSGGREPIHQPIVGVEIDDQTFYGYQNSKGPYDVTHRNLLAELVKIATQQHTAIIALDINLDRSTIDDGEESKDNQHLKDAITAANNKYIPVVLVFGFQNAKDGQPIDSLFLDTAKRSLPDGSSLPPRLRGGFDHAPDDRRKVPLKVVRKSLDHSYFVDYPSFALQIVDAYENAKGFDQRTQTRLREQLENLEFVYPSYLKRSEFQHVSAADLLCPNPDDKNCLLLIKYKTEHKTGAAALEESNQECLTTNGDQGCGEPAANSNAKSLLRDSIVLIGGNRHKYRDDCQNWLDNYDSPVGCLRGMYFQANYVASLLDNRILLSVPPIIAALIDAVLAILLLIVPSKAHSNWGKFGLAAVVSFAPIIVACLLAYFGKTRYSLDFMLPLVLLLLHPALESYIGIVQRFFT